MLVAYDRGSSSSGGVVIRYVLPVFVDDVMFARKLRLLDVAVRMKRSAHAASCRPTDTRDYFSGD